MDINPLETEQIGIQTLEKRLMKSESNISLKIGVPKEVSNDERRICLTPGGASVLIALSQLNVVVQENRKLDLTPTPDFKM